MKTINSVQHAVVFAADLLTSAHGGGRGGRRGGELPRFRGFCNDNATLDCGGRVAS